MSKESKPPVKEIRLGRIKANIWANETDQGKRYNTQIRRIYKDGDDWKETDSLGRDELLLAGKVLDQAHSWIHEQGG